jgi:hypothetical protein
MLYPVASFYIMAATQKVTSSELLPKQEIRDKKFIIYKNDFSIATTKIEAFFMLGSTFLYT